MAKLTEPGNAVSVARDPAEPDPDAPQDNREDSDLSYEDGLRHAHEFLTGRRPSSPFAGRKGLEDLHAVQPIVKGIGASVDQNNPNPPLPAIQAASQTPVNPAPSQLSAAAPTPGTPVGGTRAVSAGAPPPPSTPPSPVPTPTASSKPASAVQALPRGRSQSAVKKPFNLGDFFRSGAAAR